jgi:single-strand DNA-binding protein
MLDRRDSVNSEAPTQSTRPPESSQSAPKITPVAQDEFEDDIPF